MKIINISDYEQELNILERCFYEVEARKNIIDYMLVIGRKENPIFEETWEEYLSYLKAYNIAKNNFTINCIEKILGHNNYTGWKVDFEKKEVIINE